MGFKYDFDKYRANISIAEMAEIAGYSLNRKAGQRSYVEYRHPNENTILISVDTPNNPYINTENQTFKTRNEPDNVGTLIHFVKNRLHMFKVGHYTNEWSAAGMILDDIYAKGANQTAYRNQVHIIADSIAKDFDPSDYRIKRANDDELIYLIKKRGISPETIEVFRDYICTIQKISPKVNPYNNTGFPFTNAETGEISGYEMVNYGFKGFTEGRKKAKSFWTADLGGMGSVSMKCYIGESVIDVLSFFQLYRYAISFENTVFLSTGGALTDLQIKWLLANYPIAKKYTLFDNDLAGHCYDIRLAMAMAQKSVTIEKQKDFVNITIDGNKLEYSYEEVTLANVKNRIRLKTELVAHKTKSGKDFNEMLNDKKWSKAKLD